MMNQFDSGKEQRNMQSLFILFCNQVDKQRGILCLHCTTTRGTQICCQFSLKLITGPGDWWICDIAETPLQLSSS